MVRRFITLWLASAFSRSLGIADLWSSVAGAAIAAVIHFFPEAEQTLTPLAWQIPVWILAAVMFIRLVSSPYLLWKKEYESREEMENRNTPTLKLSFDETDPGCVRSDTKISLKGPAGTVAVLPCTFYRVRVDAVSSVAVSGCAGRMTEIRRNGISIVSGENLALTFAPGDQPDTRAKTVYPNAPEHLDFLAIVYPNNQPLVPTYQWQVPSSVAWGTLFSGTGDYRFRIVVTSPEIGSAEIQIIFTWTGDHRTARIRAA